MHSKTDIRDHRGGPRPSQEVFFGDGFARAFDKRQEDVECSIANRDLAIVFQQQAFLWNYLVPTE
jgi:hypothetical protein